ncbi:MAG: carbohydrate binding family 9 domain-containing protein [Candidatus Aminicenantes bacterium]|nr:carbohydrate binding family 9 domain-containing protein [Candidatus Aminicenantes bacterium]
MKKNLILSLSVILAASSLWAAKEKPKPTPPPAPKAVQAVRTDEPIKVDGLLDERIWQGQAADGFTQNDPMDGEPASEKTRVWVAYDDKALYVAAYCHDSEPSKIVGRLGRRDSRVDSDWFMFAVDPYLDKRTGYMFAVNPAGSIMDLALSNDVNDDESWDGVWEARAAVNGDGWTAEIRIPFHQIRFARKPEYVWGVNFRRIVIRKNEVSSYSWVPKNEAAFVSRFARLEGLRGISPGTHVEITPYTVGQAQFRPAEEGNPFETGRRYGGNVGLDLKASFQGNLTLDATVNPDFGQVEVDPAVVNLTAYETYYQERRPFFIEGASIFSGFGRGGVYINAGMNWPNPAFFYSRRIGRAPQGYVASPGHIESPDRSSILGAAKLTGKVGGWNIGLINALTARENALIDQNGYRFQEEVEPFSYYGAFRAQKDIAKGQHGIGIMATGVLRDTESPVLNGILNKNAFSLAADGWSFLDAKRTYVLGGWVGGTRVAGTVQDILRLQQSSLHYFQRPDAGHVQVDPAATSLSGWGGRLQLAKQRGNFLWVFGIGALSPGFDPNDIGFQRASSDVVNISFIPGYMWTKPGKIFQQALIAFGGLQTYDFGGNKTSEALVSILQGVFRNFWSANLEIVAYPETLSNRLTRGGPMAMSDAGWNANMMLESDGRKPFVLSGGGGVSQNSRDGYSRMVQFSLRWKPSANLSLSAGPQVFTSLSETQWVGRFSDSLMNETFGRRYVFGRIEQKMVSAEVRLNWTFTPRLSLQAYLQPFIAVGAYDRFKELARPRAYAFNVYGEGGSTIDFRNGRYTVDPDGDGPAAAFAFGNPDFNLKSLRGTVVFRWEYLPGSLLYLVWTQNRADYANPGSLDLRRDLGDLLTAPGDNIFLLKLSYRWGS